VKVKTSSFVKLFIIFLVKTEFIIIIMRVITKIIILINFFFFDKETQFQDYICWYPKSVKEIIKKII